MAVRGGRRERAPGAAWVLMTCMALQAVAGIGGGLGLVLSPDGDILQTPLSWLENTPFEDYLFPGLILLLVLGALPAVVLYGLIRRRTWAWWWSLVVGAGLVIWIVREYTWISPVTGNDPFGVMLWTVFGGLGLAIIVLSLLPSVMRWYGVRGSLKRLVE